MAPVPSFRALRVFTLTAPLIFLADQISKWVILEYLLAPSRSEPQNFLVWLATPGERTEFARLELLSFFNLTMVWNRGISFGIFGGQDLAWQAYILSALALIVCIGLFWWLLKQERLYMIIALSAIISGALGNVLDRLRFGAVADFFDFHLYGWHYPAFNIADSAIVLGVAYLALNGLFFDQNKDQNSHDPINRE